MTAPKSIIQVGNERGWSKVTKITKMTFLKSVLLLNFHQKWQKSDEKVQLFDIFCFSWKLWQSSIVKSTFPNFAKPSFTLHFGRFYVFIFIFLTGFGDNCSLNKWVSPKCGFLTWINFLRTFLIRNVTKNVKICKIFNFWHMLTQNVKPILPWFVNLL